MIYQIGPLGQIGIIADPPDDKTPLHAWTRARNIRFIDDAAEVAPGYASPFTPLIPPHAVLFVQSPGGIYWLYLGLTGVRATNGTTHADVSGAVYSATASFNWTGGVLGGIAILNNGVDAPLQWRPPSLAVPLAPLSNWPAGVTCRSLRPFKNYLVALDVTESGVRFPQMVRWSHPADPGDVPISWDYTDTTKDAGRIEIREGGDYFIDQAPLRDFNILYKERSCFAMQFIGGNEIFRFQKLFNTIGLLTRRCALEFASGKQAVFTPDDIVVHDGVQAESILERRLRRRIFSSIDGGTYVRSFVTHDPSANEVYFCFPEIGQAYPNIALVWNHKFNTAVFRDLPQVAGADLGIVSFQTGPIEDWDSDTQAWDSDTTTWDLLADNPRERRILFASPGNAAVYGTPIGTLAAGSPRQVLLERTGLGFPTRTDGPPDFTSRKLVKRIYPHVMGAFGTVINVELGTQETFDSPVVWKPARSFVVGQQKSVDITANSRLFALRFSSDSSAPWRLSAYDVEVEFAGR